MSAILLALAYGGIWLLLAAGVSEVSASPAGWLITVLSMALRILVRTVLQGLMILLIGYAILSWVQPQAPVMHMMARLVEPLLAPIRRVVPLIGGVDLSVLVLILLMQVGLLVLG
mgnify:CR=1 FL=1